MPHYGYTWQEWQRRKLATRFQFPDRLVSRRRRWDRAPLRARLVPGRLRFSDQGGHDA